MKDEDLDRQLHEWGQQALQNVPPPPPTALRTQPSTRSRWLAPAAAAAAVALVIVGVAAATSGRFQRAQTPAAQPSPEAVVPWADEPAVFETSPPRTPEPRGELTATVDLPATLAAGEVVRYTVRLSNPTRAPIALDPCPAYEQVISVLRASHQLNCAAATDVPAGGGETFEMQLRVPKAALPGPTRLTWTLLAPTTNSRGVQAEVPVVIDNPRYATPTEPRGCTTDEKEPPCGPSMVVGREYPMIANAHCEFRQLFADGRFWRPSDGSVGDGNGNPPAGWGNLGDLGIVTLTAPDTLVYESSTGDRVGLRPERPDDPDLEPCR